MTPAIPGVRSAAGFSIKSGWAAVVLLTGPASSPRLADARRVELSDPADPDGRQPYHAGFGTARAAGPDLNRRVGSVRRFGRRAAAGVLREYEAAGHVLAGAGLVVGSLIDPAGIANDHIRIHALEGRLFRQIVEQAAARRRLPCLVWRARDIYREAAATLRRPELAIRTRLAELGRDARGRWRAEDKRAALAAWLVLAGWKPPSERAGRRRSAA
ncbi:MAG: hypothetical protein AB1635_11280 [Acidobacteriota bacterium]